MVLASNFLVPNATFVVELIAFLLVLGALARWVLPPLNRMMEERQDTIRKALEDAEEARRRADETEVEYKRALDEARAQARQLVDEANRLGEELRAQARERGEQEYQRLLTRATGDIQAATQQAAEQLRGQVGELVVLVVERVIGQVMDDRAQRALIDRTISEAESEAGIGGSAAR
ncbi:MAG TPA: F0F1 ATP synthase subunit B [Acidimicrobiales bacterium]|nr:F0F1 ATP synthase subunit B [Acidimicrobiales bacterium]